MPTKTPARTAPSGSQRPGKARTPATPTGKARTAAPAKADAIPADAMRMVEALAKANAKTRKAAAEYDRLKDEEMAIRDDLVAMFGKKKIEGVKHKLGTVTTYETEYVEVEDMEALLAYAKKKGNVDLLTVSAASRAIKERWKNGVDVPGVKKGTRKDIRFTPAKASK